MLDVTPMHAVVASHGHCFDGLASAVVFTRLLRRIGSPVREVTYRTCGYAPGQQPDADQLFSGDDNALLDYRFRPHERLTWYFDHHRTAFSSEADRVLFDSRVGTGRYHYDADSGSCTKLIADVGRRDFNVEFDELAPLIEWADRVDSAAFDSPEQAIARTDPVLQLVAVVEQGGDDKFYQRYAPLLLDRPLEEVAASGDVRRRFRPLGERHARFVENVREHGTTMGRVVLVDLSDAILETMGKFVTYALYPTAVYSVMVARLRRSAKVSVGYNPWCGQKLDADIGAICARHGGGGHSVVGAVQFPPECIDQARALARDIAVELAG